jgi:hypothetical protein
VQFEVHRLGPLSRRSVTVTLSDRAEALGEAETGRAAQEACGQLGLGMGAEGNTPCALFVDRIARDQVSAQ